MIEPVFLGSSFFFNKLTKTEPKTQIKIIKLSIKIKDSGIFSLYVETLNCPRRLYGKVVGVHNIGGSVATITEKTTVKAKQIYPIKHGKYSLSLSFTLTYLSHGFLFDISNLAANLFLSVIYFAFGLLGLYGENK